MRGFQLSAEESKEGWKAVLSDVQKGRVAQLDLAVTDGNDGLIAALDGYLPRHPTKDV